MRVRFLSGPLTALMFLIVSAGPACADPAEPATATMSTEQWLQASTAPLQRGEIDRLIAAHHKEAGIQPAPLINDETFLRRVYLDLLGRLPTPTESAEFRLQADADKRAKLIDRLLDSDQFARHWAIYCRNIITSRTTDFRARLFQANFDTWLTGQFKKNVSWGKITRDIIGATGEMRSAERDKNGQAYFLSTRSGADATTELAAETSRIFLGIQIQCAQCHNHPSDVWKREQFHQFAAFFARVRERLIREENRFVGVALVSLPFGEHTMADGSDSRKPIAPKFLDGKGPEVPKGFGKQPIPKFGQGKFPPKFPPKKGFGGFGFGRGGLSDDARRKYLVEALTAKDNPWFAGAFVNRVWFELMGQTFYTPVDDMGPLKEAVMPEVLARVSGSFRGSDYDIKQLFRDVMNTDAYQRQTRNAEKGHLQFAANAPRRMQAESLYQSLVGTLGQLAGGFGGRPGFGGGFGGFGGRFGLLGAFLQEFAYDPSTRPEEIEGSVAQALLMMNNPAINQKIEAKGGNILARILDTNNKDDDAVRALYMRTLNRAPSDRELRRCLDFIGTVGNRAEAFEDILWVLINSTEYQTKR